MPRPRGEQLRINSSGFTFNLDSSVDDGQKLANAVDQLNIVTRFVSTEAQLDEAITELGGRGGGIIIITATITLTGNKTWDLSNISISGDPIGHYSGLPPKRIDFAGYKVTLSGVGCDFRDIVLNGTLSDISTIAVDSFTSPSTITLEAGEGDLTAQFTAGTKFTTSGATNGANNGTFTVVSAAFGTNTVITIAEATLVTEGASPAQMQIGSQTLFEASQGTSGQSSRTYQFIRVQFRNCVGSYACSGGQVIDLSGLNTGTDYDKYVTTRFQGVTLHTDSMSSYQKLYGLIVYYGAMGAPGEYDIDTAYMFVQDCPEGNWSNRNAFGARSDTSPASGAWIWHDPSPQIVETTNLNNIVSTDGNQPVSFSSGSPYTNFSDMFGALVILTGTGAKTVRPGVANSGTNANAGTWWDFTRTGEGATSVDVNAGVTVHYENATYTGEVFSIGSHPWVRYRFVCIAEDEWILLAISSHLVGDTTGEPMGFESQDDTESTVTWEDTTPSITVAPVGASFDVWVKGKRYRKTASEQLQGDGTDFTIAEGLWFFYYDDTGALQASQTPWQFPEHAPVAIIRWDATGAQAIDWFEERHGLMPWPTHKHFHLTIGTRYESGLGLAGNTTGDGSADSHAQVDISDGTISDEDIDIDITDYVATPGRFVQELSPIANIPIFYLLGATPVWRRQNATAFPLIQGAARIQYNLDTVGTWSLADAPNNGDYVAVFLFATNNRSVPSDGVAWEEPIVGIVGQRSDGTLANAQLNNTLEGLTLPVELGPEAKPIYRLIFQTSATYANTPHARLRDILDYRRTSTVPGTYNPTTHNSLSGRSTYPTHPASSLSVPQVGAATYGSVQDFVNTQSAGKLSGGDVTDAGAGAVNVAAGTGVVKSSDSNLGPLLFFDWAAAAGVALTDNAMNYVYVDYNAGSPTVAATTNPAGIDGHTQVLLSTVYRKGTVLYITGVGQCVDDAVRRLQQQSQEVEGTRRAGGMLIAQSGSRYVTVSAGYAWAGLNQLITSAIDTTGADTFEEWYRDGGGGYTRVAGSTQINNQSYDDGTGTLAALGNNKFGVRWFFLFPDSADVLMMVYGRAAHNSLAAAESEALPTDLPQLFNYASILIGRAIVEYNAATAQVQSAFGEHFLFQSVAEHNYLNGLQGGQANEYYHLTAAQHADTLRGWPVAIAVNQVAHGFTDPTSAVTVIRHNGTQWVKAQADTAANAEGCWVVTSVPDVDNFVAQKVGDVDITGWGLTAGIVYFLDPSTAGAITTTKTTTNGQVQLPIVQAHTVTRGEIMHLIGTVVGGGVIVHNSLTGRDTYPAHPITAISNAGSAGQVPISDGGGNFTMGAPAPATHATSHQNGGSDEINVGGLSGTLADPQPPQTHASTHSDGGSDEITLENLATSGGVGTVPVAKADGSVQMVKHYVVAPTDDLVAIVAAAGANSEIILAEGTHDIGTNPLVINGKTNLVIRGTAASIISSTLTTGAVIDIDGATGVELSGFGLATVTDGDMINVGGTNTGLHIHHITAVSTHATLSADFLDMSGTTTAQSDITIAECHVSGDITTFARFATAHSTGTAFIGVRLIRNQVSTDVKTDDGVVLSNSSDGTIYGVVIFECGFTGFVNGITASSTTSLGVERCGVTNCGSAVTDAGIEIGSGCSLVKVKGCSITNQTGIGISSTGGAAIDANEINTTTGEGILVTGGAGDRITNNVINLAGLEGISLTTAATESTIFGNKIFDNGAGYGIEVISGVEHEVVNNRVDQSAAQGIYLNSGRLRCKLSLNTIIDAGANGFDIQEGANNCTITGNLVYNASGDGLNVDADGATVQGNFVQGCSGNGIELGDTNNMVANVTCQGNTSTGNTSAGIACRTTNSNITGNLTYSNGTYGIIEQGDNPPVPSGNHFADNRSHSNTTADFSFAAYATGRTFGVEQAANVTDNAIMREDGTSGRLAQGSLATIDDSGNITTPGSVAAANAFVHGPARQLLHYLADMFLIPNTSDWGVNAPAAVIDDPTNAAIAVAAFDDTDEEGVGMEVYVPTGATDLIFVMEHRAETGQTGDQTVDCRMRFRAVPDDSGIPVSWTVVDMNQFTLPSGDTDFFYTVRRFSLSAVGMTAGQAYQIEWTRYPDGDDSVVDDWYLRAIRIYVDFSGIKWFPADTMQSVFSDWSVNNNAPIATDSANTAIKERLHDDTTEEGCGIQMHVPSGVAKMGLTLIHRATTQPTTHAVDSFTAPDQITLEAGVGDVTAQYPAGRKIVVSGATTGANNGTFTVESSTFGTNTVITTVETTLVTEGASPAIASPWKKVGVTHHYREHANDAAAGTWYQNDLADVDIPSGQSTPYWQEDFWEIDLAGLTNPINPGSTYMFEFTRNTGDADDDLVDDWATWMYGIEFY